MQPGNVKGYVHRGYINRTCSLGFSKIGGIMIHLIQQENNRDIRTEKEKKKKRHKTELLPIPFTNLNKNLELPIHPVNSISSEHRNGPVLLILHM